MAFGVEMRFFSVICAFFWFENAKFGDSTVVVNWPWRVIDSYDPGKELGST